MAANSFIVVRDDAARDALARLGHHGDHVAAPEGALHAAQSGGQQAAVALAERPPPRRRPPRVRRPTRPGPLSSQRLRPLHRRHAGGEKGADRFAARRAHHHVGDVAAGQRDRNARRGCALGGQQLGQHSAASGAVGRRLREGEHRVVHGVHALHQARVGVAVGVGGEEAAAVGEHQQQVGVDEVGDGGRRGVSLSPKRSWPISAVSTTSFSFTMGTTPAPSSPSRVLRTLR